MSWSDVGSSLKNHGLAVLGNVLTGNIPGAVVQVGSMVADAIGVENEPYFVQQAIQADPNLVLKLKDLDVQLQNKAIDAVMQDRNLSVEDTKDARRRDIDLRHAGFDNKRANYMIFGDIVGLLACLGAMIYITWLGVTGGSDGSADPIVMAINGPLGMLTQQFANGLRDAHQFEFGSSRGSKVKDYLKSPGSGAE